MKPAQVETQAYTGEPPWSGLGNKVTNKLTPEQMLKAASLDWTVSKQPLYMAEGKLLGPQVPSKFALRRDSDKSVLSVVGRVYKPVQNAKMLAFFKKFTEAGHMEMDTAGSLAGGRYIWALAKIGESFSLGKEDEINGYLLLISPHVIGRSLVAQFTSVRRWCWNTLPFLLGTRIGTGDRARDKARGTFRMPHSIDFNDSVVARAEVALGLAKDQMLSFKEAATLLSKKKAKPTEVQDYFFEVLKLDADARKERVEEGQREPRLVDRFTRALEFAPGQQVDSAKGMWWGALNAVTYVADHEMGNSRDTGLRNAWLGGAARMKRRALDLAIQKAS